MKSLMIKSGLAILLLISTANCTRITIPTQPSQTTPIVDTTPKVIHDSIVFHVIGNAIAAKIRYSDSFNGLNQVTTTLPFQSTIDSTKDNTFLSLEATSTGYSALIDNPFLAIQILVNGNLFREASTNSFLNQTISISGTYRR